MAKKWTIIYFLLVSVSFAATSVSLEKSDIDGLKQLAITSEKQNYLVLNTNQFKIYPTKSIGKFQIKNNIKSQIKKLNKIHKRIIKIDERLKENNSSFGELNKVIGHSTYIKLGNFKLPRSHDYYDEVYEIFSSILKEIKLKKVDVVKFERKDKGAQYTFYKNDKIVKENPISLNFYCRTSDNKRVCLVKEYGHISIDE